MFSANRLGFRQVAGRRWQAWLFMAFLTGVLLVGVPRLLADPTRPAADSTALVVIDEVQVNNAAGIVLDEDGDASDWIELYNRTERDLSLSGWSLTDDPTQPDQWIFRDITIPAHGRLLVFASGKNRRTIEVDEDTGASGYLHTNFRLASDGGFLALYPPTSRRFSDGSSIEYPPQAPGDAFGRAEGAGNSFGYLVAATPGEANAGLAAAGMTAPVEFSEPHGIYEQAFTLSLYTATPGAEIRYTLDGSVPSADHGQVYAEPFQIDGTTLVRAVAVMPDYRTAPTETRSYIFLEDVRNQPEAPAGWPQSWGTHQIDFGGNQVGAPVTPDYAMDPEIVNDPVYGAQLAEAFRELPVLSLVTDMADLDIYSMPQSKGREFERPVSVELFDPRGGEPGFQVNAGLRIQGGASRWEFMPKHSFRVYFRRDYGPPTLNYQVFADSPTTEFDRLVLRAGTDRGFAGHPPAPETVKDHRGDTYGNDQWALDTQQAMLDFAVHGRFVHLFLNGLYWGIYRLVEQPDSRFMAAYFGGAADEYTVVSHGGLEEGPGDRFETLRRLAEAGGLAEPERYRTMLEFVDPLQFSDYVLLNWYAGNTDWPENNWFIGVRNPAGRNLFFSWDSEMTWLDGAQVRLGTDGWEGAPYPNIIKQVFIALMENPDYRMLFADRVRALTRPGGVLSDDEARTRWLQVLAPLEVPVVAESARWGDARYAEPITQDDWRRGRDAVLVQMEGNADRLIQQLRAAEYYPPIDPPVFSQLEQRFADRLNLTLAAPAGDIYFTTDGSDPRLPITGEVSPTARRFVEPLILDSATTVKARVHSGSTWSALEEVTFRRGNQGPNIQISEIMYNPPGGEDYEYIELTNYGEVEADLSGAFFEGIDYRFPLHTRLAPGARAVIVADFRRFRSRYEAAEIAGVFEGILSDRGERIALRRPDGSPLAMVDYKDEDGWPLSADGRGDSLELIDAAGNPSAPHNWRASELEYGTPGS